MSVGELYKIVIFHRNFSNYSDKLNFPTSCNKFDIFRLSQNSSGLYIWVINIGIFIVTIQPPPNQLANIDFDVIGTSDY